MTKDTINNIYGLICYADTDAVKVKTGGQYSIGYITRFTAEWERVTGKLKRFPAVNNIPLVPEDRSHEKVKRIKI